MKAYEIIGFVPADGGYALCVDCACNAGINVDDADESEGTPIFAGDEGEFTCDSCGCSIKE